MMCSSVKVVFLATFALGSLCTSTESINLDHNSYVRFDNRTLARLKRQISEKPCHTDLTKYQCDSGECVDIDVQCDGRADCEDGSDEKESLCKDIYCPGYLFRCAYGACLTRDKRCDGIKDCNDNSDEIDCQVRNKINSNCRSDQFECANGQCIEIDGKCNGVTECNDKSDETEELCFNIYCPGYTYKCKYGACVDGDARCNGVANCMDRSDEINCGTVQPPVTPGSGVQGKKCLTPHQPINGKWVYHHDHVKGPANVWEDTNTAIIFSCDNGYKLSTTPEPTLPIYCMEDGHWSVSVIPQCLKLCPPQYNNPLVTLSCKNDGVPVSCDKATQNTILTYKCGPYYESVVWSKNIICTDGSWSYKPECVPVCGEKRVSATPLIVNGKEVERGNYPWVVALYSNREDAWYQNICGGSLIRVNVVLTAAHCVTKKETGKLYPARYFKVGAGKYYNEYGDARDNDTAQYVDVAEIKIHAAYKGEIQNFRADFALMKLKTPFALSKVVQPVCMLNPTPDLEPNTIGLVTGWGFTTSSGDPSETLKEIELPYTDDAKCRSQLEPEFAERYLIEDKLCAGFDNENRSVCKGDSGGGLVVKNPINQKRFYIHGVVSLGHSYTENQQIHCNVQKSALFTRVGTYSDWIENILLRWSTTDDKQM